jgi:hypothetical protein|uniref:DUF4926 domain-containing protein n=1 Tax=uncultured Sphingomonas sp. TaxID=158754 RepID=UPI0035CCA215
MPTSVSPVPMRPEYAELDLVRLRSILYTEAGTIPAGSQGTIVFSHDHGAAYEVEFVAPFPLVATLRAADLAAA